MKPLREKSSYYRPIELAIVDFFETFIFSKLLAIAAGEYQNDMDALKDALLKGRIQYAGGKFTGQFSAKTSKQLRDLGAKWDKGFSLSVDKIPQDIQQIIGTSQTMFKQLYDKILAELAAIDIPAAIKSLPLQSLFFTSLDDMDTETYEALKADIAIVPEFTPEMKKALAEEYTTNMEKYVQDFSEKEIIKLRKLVEENTFEGGQRAENLYAIIQHEFGVSQSKARFLARQETSLLVSKFREVRYKSAGVSRYKWSSSHDVRVRPLHKSLDGQIFSWDDPPIIDDRTGERGHPGEAFGCRCVAIPVLD